MAAGRDSLPPSAPDPFSLAVKLEEEALPLSLAGGGLRFEGWGIRFEGWGLSCKTWTVPLEL